MQDSINPRTLDSAHRCACQASMLEIGNHSGDFGIRLGESNGRVGSKRACSIVESVEKACTLLHRSSCIGLFGLVAGEFVQIGN